MKSRCSLGTDLVEVSRIGGSVKSKRFVKKIFTPDEIAYCKSKKNFAQHYAVRFAAKEAVWKALSHTGTRGISFQEITISRSPNGKPHVVLSKRLKKFEPRLSLSLSHTKEYALAVALYDAS